MSEFYEADEPLEDIVAAFGAGPHLLTGRSGDGVSGERWVSGDGLCVLSVTPGDVVAAPIFAGQPMRPLDGQHR